MNNNNAARREIGFRYDSESLEMCIDYNPGAERTPRRVLSIKPWTGHARFYVNESKAAGCSKWLIAVTVRGTPPEDIEVKYELADFDL